MFDSHETLLIIARSFFSLITLYLITRMLGKKLLSQLTIYDYIVGITIGSLGADTIISLDKHFLNGIIAIFVFGISALVISWLSLKSSKLNKVFNGKPTILMENGEFVYENLRSSKISICKFIEQARINGYYDLDIINYAILETNGQISFLPKEEYQKVNLKDLKANVKTKSDKQTYCLNIIIDGDIQKDILSFMGKDEEWLTKEMKKLKVFDLSKIVLATIDQNNKIKVFRELL